MNGPSTGVRRVLPLRVSLHGAPPDERIVKPIGAHIGITPERSIAPIRRLERTAAERGPELVPGHDPVGWPDLMRRLGNPPPAAPQREVDRERSAGGR
ncbi:hypothetical protein [Pseudonocardia sp. ICBG1293]|uniref:hypothetical protein n=1 Tax=Pseudonocardia sp. ICBG1293 TaxID=2844382 RepID=UPI001CD02581|nr:hypothetical protein [Pseudonocardia sp. ICBG1293]